MILVIGEILFDVFPGYKILGGAPFNFAYHLKNFGFPVRFISRIGMDENGRQILDRIKKAGFDPNDIQIEEAHPTGTVRVQLDEDGVPAFEIIPEVAYDYIECVPKTHFELLASASLVYFGTLSQRTRQGFKNVQKLLERIEPECTALYDINLRPDCYSPEIVEATLQKSDILKLNTDELHECKRILGSEQGDRSFIQHLMAEHSLKAISLTGGGEGSELHTKSGFERVKPVPVNSLIDTVGAGDAYAAMLAAGILRKWKPRTTLSRATEFASRVCTITGAIPESAGFYDSIRKYLANGA